MSAPTPDLLRLALLLLLLAAASLALGILAVRSLADRRRLLGRAAALAPAASPAPVQRSRGASALAAGAPAGLIETFLGAHLDAGGRVQSWLSAAGIATSLSRFLLLSVGASAIAALALHAMGLAGVPLLLAWLLLLVGLPSLVLHMLQQRRRARFRALLPEALGLMVRGLRAGVPVLETVEAAVREFDEPLRGVFRRALDQARLGQPLEGALMQEGRLLRLPEFDFLVVALSIQRETGGNLAETLDGLADLVRRRGQLALRLRALSSEARASAVIIGALPILLAAMMSWMAPDYVAPLFQTSAGQLLLGLGMLSLAVGAAIMATLVRLEA